MIQVGNAYVPNIDWSQSVVRGINPCVAQWSATGTIDLTSNSKKAGCTTFNYVITPTYAARFTPSYDPRLRLQAVPTADLSFMKITTIAERVRLQFRAEAFNITNTYWFGQQQFNSTATSAAFGTFNKNSVAFTSSNQPRYVQLAFKLLW